MNNPLIFLHGDLSIESIFKAIANQLSIQPSDVTYTTDLREYFDMDYELLEAIKEIEKELHIVFGEDLTTRLLTKNPLTAYEVIIIANEAVKRQVYGTEDNWQFVDYKID